MENTKLGRQTFQPGQPPVIIGFGSAAGNKESSGPLGRHFDHTCKDDKFGAKTWEQAESAMQGLALDAALKRAGLHTPDLDLMLAGDLLNQCIGSGYAARAADVPFLGLYGACSTMGEGLALAAMTLDGGFGEWAAVTASSHFCSAERQYRTPLEYGGQRTPTSQWTATAAGAAVLAREGPGPYITHVTVGKIVDKGVTDTNNMGAAMAPAAFDTIISHFNDTGRSPGSYDMIFTGDLGTLGSELLVELLRKSGIQVKNHGDCGAMLFDIKNQDVHCGGSGCGCCASVLTGYILNNLKAKTWKNILFCPTGALHSPTSAFQGESIPGICHAIAISTQK